MLRGEWSNVGGNHIDGYSKVYFHAMTNSLSHPRLFYFNPLFDLELGGYPTGAVAASAKQMSPLFALMGTDRDRVILDVKAPPEYWEYLSAQGIDHARPVNDGEDLSGFKGVPWGWNRQSLDRLTSFGAQCTHPNLATVKRVNSRAWCAAFNRESGTGVSGSCFCATTTELDAALDRLAGRFPLVAKTAFGNSGYGFARMRGTAGFSRGQRAQIETMLLQGGCTLEPWLDRIADLSSSCVIQPDGIVTDMHHYHCHITGHGAFYGVSLGVRDPRLERFESMLEAAARNAASTLFRAGYFGPASFDSIVYRDTGTDDELIAAVVEINARYGMSAIARALHEKIGPNRCVFLRFIGRKKMELPESYDGMQALLGNDRYDPATRTGILLVSPPRIIYGSEKIQPGRCVFLCVEKEASALWSRDERLRMID
jgi:hypothetical protein